MSFSTESLPSPIRRIVAHQEVALAVGVAWLLGPAFGALGFFYIGTIFDSKHIIDLQVENMTGALPFAAVGLLLGVLLAVAVTAFFPAAYENEQSSNH